MVIYALWLMMAYTAARIGENGEVEGSALMTAGLSNLRFFTVLSNILEGVACLALLIAAAVSKGSAGASGAAASASDTAASAAGRAIPLWAAELKLAAAASVALTFITVMVFLGPMLGYKYLFTGSNLWFHGIIPIAAMVEFAFIDCYEGFPAVPFKATFTAVIPMLLYGVWYLINVIRGGMADGRFVNDWYGFAMWGIPASLLVYVVIAAVTWLFALLLRCGNLRLR